jgi:predicted ATPase
VHSQSEGNPFFVGEIARLLVSEDRLGADGHLDLTIPEGVREVIDRRLNRLTESCNGVLAVAAVEGRDFDLSVVSQAAGVPASEVLETLDEAVDAHLVTEAGSGPGRYRFAHALVREVVYAGLRVTERVRLHHRVGEAIERHSQPDLEARLAELAHHFLQSSTIGDADKAVEYASRAGKLALDMLAYEQAAGHFEVPFRRWSSHLRVTDTAAASCCWSWARPNGQPVTSPPRAPATSRRPRRPSASGRPSCWPERPLGSAWSSPSAWWTTWRSGCLGKR